MNKLISKYVNQIVLPKPDSHKGENGRVFVIGGSKLFHAASFWAACMVAKIVDMVHFSSPAMENNELMRVSAKKKFWEGIVVPWEEVEHYIQEDDCILIGPGMTRSTSEESRSRKQDSSDNTKEVVNRLLKKYPDKRWVVDGGALQEVDVSLLNEDMIVTPNKREREILEQKAGIKIQELGFKREVTILAKGQIDVISSGGERVEVAGGTAAMTKGGTGDVLAGIVAGLYAKSPAMAACVVASQANKTAGEQLEAKMGPFFGAGDLISEVQKVLGKML